MGRLIGRLVDRLVGRCVVIFGLLVGGYASLLMGWQLSKSAGLLASRLRGR